jgi:hypothetical protein
MKFSESISKNRMRNYQKLVPYFWGKKSGEEHSARNMRMVTTSGQLWAIPPKPGALPSFFIGVFAVISASYTRRREALEVRHFKEVR